MNINGINYYVPVSSKIKSVQDNILIRDKNNQIKGSLRLSYVIPVPNNCIKSLITDNISDSNRKILISKESAFCRRNKDKIMGQAIKTYERVISNKYPSLNQNSCDFKLSEKAYIDYCNEEK